MANRTDRERMSHLLLEVTPNLVALFADVNKVLIKHLTRCTKKAFSRECAALYPVNVQRCCLVQAQEEFAGTLLGCLETNIQNQKQA